MHILMIAPEPFFEPRGTPSREFHRIRALTELGHTVDLVTYPFGRDVSLPGLRVFRCLRPPFMSRDRDRSLLAKVPLDLALALTRAAAGADAAATTRSTRTRRAASIGVVLAALLRRAAPLRHAFEPAAADDELRLQPRHAGCTRLFGWLERLMIRQSRVVIVICPQLGDDRPRDRRRRADGADRERARLRRCAARRHRARDPRGARA